MTSMTRRRTRDDGGRRGGIDDSVGERLFFRHQLLSFFLVLFLSVGAVIVYNAVSVSNRYSDVELALFGEEGDHTKPLDTSPQIALPTTIEADKLATRLSKAIQLRTVSLEDRVKIDYSQFLQFHEFLLKTYPLTHQHLKREIVNNYSLLYTWECAKTETDPKAILFAAHIDVVPATNDDSSKNAWLHPPFSGSIVKEGNETFIYGRGALDMKGQLLAIMESIEMILKSGVTSPQKTIYLAFGHDEEIGGEYGGKAISNLLTSRNVKLDVVFDEGLPIGAQLFKFISNDIAMIGVSEKGHLTVKIAVYSSPGHSSPPPTHTSTSLLVKALDVVLENPPPPKLTEPVTTFLETLLPHYRFWHKIIFANIPIFRPLITFLIARDPISRALVRSTIAVTHISTPESKLNVLPTYAESILNIRLTQGDTIDGVVEYMRNLLHRKMGDKDLVEVLVGNDGDGINRVKQAANRIVIEPISETLSSTTSGRRHPIRMNHNASPISRMDTRYYALLARSIRRVFGKTTLVAPNALVGNTDSMHYQKLLSPSALNIYKFLPVSMKREDVKRIHGYNERISVEGLEKLVEFWFLVVRGSMT